MARGADDQTGDAFNFFNDGSQKPKRADKTPSAESPIFDDPFADDFSSVPSVCDSWDYNQRWKIKAKRITVEMYNDLNNFGVGPATDLVGWEPVGATATVLLYRRPICDKP